MSRPSHLKTSIIMVPGACHTAYHVYPLAATLKAHGGQPVLPSPGDEYANRIINSYIQARNNHSALLPHQPRTGKDFSRYRIVPRPLYAAGVKEPSATFDLDIGCIQSAIAAEAGRPDVDKVCLISHSASGLACLEAINRYIHTGTVINNTAGSHAETAKLSTFVCVSSVLRSEHMLQRLGLAAGWLHFDPRKGFLTIIDGEKAMYSDMSSEAANPYVKAFVPHMSTSESDTIADGKQLLSSERWKLVARKIYLVCEQDQAITVERQENEANDLDMEALRFPGGHCAFTSQPDQFADILDDILSA